MKKLILALILIVPLCLLFACNEADGGADADNSAVKQSTVVPIISTSGSAVFSTVFSDSDFEKDDSISQNKSDDEISKISEDPNDDSSPSVAPDSSENTGADSSSERSQFTVTFDTDGVLDIERIQVDCGETITEPVINSPFMKGNDVYEFTGWYLGEVIFDFSTPITEDITLIARFNIEKYSSGLPIRR